ncbi:MAG: hypothetical protein QG670_2384 [Thermoproteota archaeon]|nr:hypothetical protein [Thermoproteota archaeon]
MSEKIDEILEFLTIGGRNYSIEDISTTMNISFDTCEQILQFLVKYGFVDSSGKNFKINLKIRDMLLSTSEEYPSELIASSVI